MGFRFGEPLDVDGDDRADIAAGARFHLQGIHQNGMATVWSGSSGRPIRLWEGESLDGLFGHWVLPVADLGGDGLADVVIAAPNTTTDGVIRGLLVARSPQSGQEHWRRSGDRHENLGWDLALAGDQDGDGRVDLFVGAPSQEGGRVYLVSGRTGTLLQRYSLDKPVPTFGWVVAGAGDCDGDGRADLVVGAPLAERQAGVPTGAAYVLASRTGAILREWRGAERLSGFGEMIASVGDLDGDGHGEIAVAAPRTNDQRRSLPGEVFIYSGASSRIVRHWPGTQPGELFGRMVCSAGDVNADGVADVAIGAPWHRHEGAERAGRVELRCGRTGKVLWNLRGDVPDGWFGWHIRRAPDPAGQGRPTLLISALRRPANGQAGSGALELWVLRRPAAVDSGNDQPRQTPQRHQVDP